MRHNRQNGKLTAKEAGRYKRIGWHTAFREAMRTDLSDYSDILEYQEEVPLTAEPLKMDLLIIKKKQGREIDKEIGRQFRGYNIIEYKSPSDSISVRDYHKVCGYVYQYIYLNDVGITDVTLTLIGDRNPRELLRFLRQIGHEADERTSGIYESRTNVFPIRIIETKRLPESESVWLRSLAG